MTIHVTSVTSPNQQIYKLVHHISQTIFEVILADGFPKSSPDFFKKFEHGLLSVRYLLLISVTENFTVSTENRSHQCNTANKTIISY